MGVVVVVGRDVGVSVGVAGHACVFLELFRAALVCEA